jgi:tetraacyldisaccharide 4'-kinase
MNEPNSWTRRVWARQDLLANAAWVLALPLSFAYAAAVGLRSCLYRRTWLPTKTLPGAVVSVGNLTVGGTGKTPTTLWLANELRQRGYRVAILTRGYRRIGRGPLVLSSGVLAAAPPEGAPADAAGDEACMMSKLFGQTLGVAEKRYQAGMTVLGVEKIDVFILDDGFQHQQLKRDLDLVLLGDDCSGWLLPAGPFRESFCGLARAQLFLVTGAKEKWPQILNGNHKQGEVFFGALRARCVRTWEEDRWSEYPLSRMTGAKILAISGIANPALFYRMIDDWQGKIVDVLEFEDHHIYSQHDWQRISRGARKAEMIVTTEKDIVKLMRFPFARGQLFALRVEMVVERGQALMATVERAVRERLKVIRGGDE